MELRHLRYFLTVAELGTVTAAAEHLRVAQPAVSRQIQGLEREVGVQLFHRRGPRLVLSDAGRHFVEVSQDLLTRADRVTALADHMATGNLARIVCAAASTTIDYVLAPFVATLEPDDPFISVVSVTGDAVHQAVRAGHDLGVSASAPPAASLAWLPLTSVPLRAYVAADHPWADRRSIGIAEVVESPLIMPADTDPTRVVFDAAVVAAGLSYHQHEDVRWPPMRQALAAAGRGVAIATDLPAHGARPLLLRGADGGDVRLSLHACWNSEHYAAEALERFAVRLAAFSEQRVRPEAEAI